MLALLLATRFIAGIWRVVESTVSENVRFSNPTFKSRMKELRVGLVMSSTNDVTWIADIVTNGLVLISSTTISVSEMYVLLEAVPNSRFCLMAFKSEVVMFTVIMGEFSRELLPPVRVKYELGDDIVSADCITI